MKKTAIASIFALASATLLSQAQAAEYSEADDIPQVTSITFTESAVVLTLERYYVGGEYREGPRFLADRIDYEFRQVSTEVFADLANQNAVHIDVGEYVKPDIEITYSDDCQESGYRYDSGPHNLTGRTFIQLKSNSIEVEIMCRSSIADTKLIDSQLWLGTVTYGDHGSYGAEGVIVVSGDGKPATWVDVGRYPVEAIADDPWSSDVWVITQNQLALVSKGREVKSRYWKYFDFVENLPDILVRTSDSPLSNNPLAVLSSWLGESSYEGLSQASQDGVALPGREPLYNMAMFGNYYFHQPQWPEELVSVLDGAKVTHGWRKFACLVPGDRAKTLCETELADWPQE